MAGLVVVGTLLVDEILTLSAEPVPGSQQRALGRRVTGGGQVWHTALAAASAGAAVTTVGRRGDDREGAHLAALLERAGVADSLTALGPSRRAVVLLYPSGERAIVSVPQRDQPALGAPDAHVAAVIGAAGWVHLDGYALDDATGDLALLAARAAVDAGVRLSLEPPSATGLPLRRIRLAALPPLDLLVGRPEELAATLAVLGPAPSVVVTHDGPAPVTWAAAGETVEVAVPASGGVATLGAGDRFTGGLLAAVLRGAGPAAALQAGVVAAFRGSPA